MTSNRFCNIKFQMVFLTMCFCASGALHAQIPLVGVNLAGADFGFNNLPGTYGTDYTYPTQEEIDYFTSKGMNVFRLPFRWERLQTQAYGSFDAQELARIDNFVNYAVSKQAQVILDPHNYSRYYGNVIGSNDLAVAAFEDFWMKLAEHYKTNSSVIFGLMNEPNSMSTELWLGNANAAIGAIRATGATNQILVPGNGWTGAHSWDVDWYGTPNSVVMQNIIDPLDNYAFEVHQYLDSNSSGQSADCVSSTIGSARLVEFTNWLRQHNEKGFLGEFAGGVNATCLAALDDMLNFIDTNQDVWIGWAYWAAGPWWGEYIFTLEPNADGSDREQMAVLLDHMGITDSDNDGHGDSEDNCILIANADQRDSNNDGYGNICDPDLNGDQVVNFADIAAWIPSFNTFNKGDVDFDGDGFVNFGDFVVLSNFFLLPPGPSGVVP